MLAQILKPKHFLLGHWENFFLPWSDTIQQLRAVPFTNPEQFIDRLQHANTNAAWVMPAPNASVTY